MLAISCPTTSTCFVGSSDGRIQTTANAGLTWTSQSSGVITAINGISCASASTCVAVGDFGAAIWTANGGLTWTDVTVNGGSFLAGVSCPTTSICFAVGYAGSMLMSGDGGSSWVPQTSNTTHDLFGISCPSPSVCFAVGAAIPAGAYNGVITATTNGGATWAQQNPGAVRDLDAISCFSVSNCTASGQNATTDTTNNEGSSWAVQYGAGNGGVDFFGIGCPTSSQCYMAGADGNVYFLSSLFGLFSGYLLFASTGAQGGLYAIACPMAATCLAAGDYGTVVTTSNSGTGWKVQAPGNMSDGNAISCPSTSTCWAVGSAGNSGGVVAWTAVEVTTDGGATWSQQDSGLSPAASLNAITCLSTTNCFVAGWSGSSGTVIETTNGGTSWNAEPINLPFDALNGITCPSASTCFAVGSRGTILRTTNGGGTWTSESSGTSNTLFGISCPSSSVCFVGGSGVMLNTTNGGGAWSTQLVTGPSFTGISCPSVTTCFAVGPQQILATTNGGTTWTDQTPSSSFSPLHAVMCPSNTLCYAGSDNGIFVTTNGATWLPQSSSTGYLLQSVSCPTASACFASNGGGVVLGTTNGGTAWRFLAPSGTKGNLSSVSCPSSTTCFAVGNSYLGVPEIFMTTNSGQLWSLSLVVNNNTFYAISCPSTSVCFAMGTGSVYATTNGGGTWTAETPLLPERYGGISCSTTTNCIAVNTSGTFIKTVDGINWSAPAPTVSGASLNAISCPSIGLCFTTDQKAYVYKTTNDGASWTVSFDINTDPEAGNSGPFAGISCPSASVCYASGIGGLVATTTDGGTNWRTDTLPSGVGPTSISCPSVSTCYAANNGGEIVHTTDLGGTWDVEFAGANADLAGISCPTVIECYAVGSNGIITTTTDGGAAWGRPLPQGSTNYIGAMSCTSANECYAAAGDTLLVTHNGGVAWSTTQLTTTDFLDGISCPAAGTCFAVGWPGAIYFTGDGGTTWTYQPSFISGADVTLLSVSCSSATTCVAVSVLGTIISTTNGSTWAAESSGTTQVLTSVSCPTTSSCLAVGFNGITLTRTGGTWKTHASGTTNNLNAVTCPSAIACYAVGDAGTSLFTQNLGATWTGQVSGTAQALNGVNCTRPAECLAVGNFGTAVVTLDGSHWSPLNTPTFNALLTVVFQDLNHAWVAGNGGTILANSSLTPGCGSASVTLSPASPQPAGTSVGLTGSAIGCSSPTYEFWLQYPSGTWYLARSWGGPTFNWSTTGLVPGTYTVHVWANQLGDSTSTYEALGGTTFVLTGCTAASLSPPSVTQAVGSTVSLTASAVGCPNPEFEYWVQYPTGSWYLLRAWGGSTLNWPTTGLTPGLYTVHVWANQVGASLATYETIGAGSVGLSVCTGAALSPSNPSPPAGSTVALTASSTGCASPLYEFWVQYPDMSWHLVRPFGTSATFNWNSSGLAPGSYTVHVWAKSLGDPIGTFEVFGSDTVTLTGCTTASVTLSSPAPAGAVVSMTGAGSAGCPNPQFEFWVQYPDLSWHFGRTWGPAAWNWVTTGLKPGAYTIHAWANQIGASIATYEAIGVANVTLSGCTAASVAPPSSSDAVGTSIPFTVTPTCPTTAIYEFWLQYPDLSWHLEQGFSPTNTWSWHSTGFPKGSYVIHVWVNDRGADTSTYETIGAATHTLS